MKNIRTIFIAAVLTAAILFSGNTFAAYNTVVKQPASKSTKTKSQKNAVSKTASKKLPKTTKKSSKSIDDLAKAKASLPISDEVIQALAKSEIEEAVRNLRIEAGSPRALYLLRLMQGIMLYDKGDFDKKNLHQTYQNMGIAYHNLYLFLKANSSNNDNFFAKAKGFYKKALGKCKTAEQRAEQHLLMSSLLAEHGDIKEAKKTRDKVSKTKIENNALMLEYEATYLSAINDVDGAIEALTKSSAIDPDGIISWVAVSDDFYRIKNDPKFQDLLKQLHVDKKARELENRAKGTSKKIIK